MPCGEAGFASYCWASTTSWGGVLGTTRVMSTSKPSTDLKASLSRPRYRSVTILQIKSLRTDRVIWLESSKLMGSNPSI